MEYFKWTQTNYEKYSTCWPYHTFTMYNNTVMEEDYPSLFTITLKNTFIRVFLLNNLHWILFIYVGVITEIKVIQQAHYVCMVMSKLFYIHTSLSVFQTSTKPLIERLYRQLKCSIHTLMRKLKAPSPSLFFTALYAWPTMTISHLLNVKVIKPLLSFNRCQRRIYYKGTRTCLNCLVTVVNCQACWFDNHITT